MLRDGLELLCSGLGDDWAGWVDYILGNQPNLPSSSPDKRPSDSLVEIRPARIPDKLRSVLGKDERLKQALTFIKPGIEVDEASGTAKKRHLRFYEMSRAGMILASECTIHSDSTTAQALLVAAAKLVDRIGGKRRRGAGRCVLSANNILAEDAAVQHLEECVKSGDCKPPASNSSHKHAELKIVSPNTDDAPDKMPEWNSVEYRIELESPVSLTTATLGNVAKSLDFIPGTYLLGHIRNKLGQGALETIVRGDMRVLPATIEIDDKRGLPVPRLLEMEKSPKDRNKVKTYNSLIADLSKESQTKPLREGFVANLDSEEIVHANVPMTISAHNSIDDRRQRPTSEIGGIFFREAIQARTILRGEIRWKSSTGIDFTELAKLNGSIRIGASKKDDYGDARFVLLAKTDSVESQGNIKRKEIKIGDSLTVYCSTDVLLRDERLRFTSSLDAFAADIETSIGRSNLIQPIDGGSAIATRRIESWQIRWGFPRPSLVSIAGGSVIRFKALQNVSADELDLIELCGVGERKGEGYGHIMVNPVGLSLDELEYRRWESSTVQDVIKGTGELSSDLKGFVNMVYKSAFRKELSSAAQKAAANANFRKDVFGFDSATNSPPMSQIGNLRAILSSVRKFDDATKVTNWLTSVEASKSRSKVWTETKRKKLKDLFSAEEDIWGKLVPYLPEMCKADDETAKSVRRDLWGEAIRFTFSACQHAHKREMERKEKQAEAVNG
jgi:CRISPR-associated protein Csx10